MAATKIFFITWFSSSTHSKVFQIWKTLILGSLLGNLLKYNGLEEVVPMTFRRLPGSRREDFKEVF
ncbi:hypothetical protein F2Q69_00028288 [Brassica cretica]|uniref:Uncharacterized protein n=1 Tax=Brassica cretica TaxID=69181 RepID=A0A8S9S598_BRACR|nr:hypothetical protein F2Q69_00028288 [Brassica cretica]